MKTQIKTFTQKELSKMTEKDIMALDNYNAFTNQKEPRLIGYAFVAETKLRLSNGILIKELRTGSGNGLVYLRTNGATITLEMQTSSFDKAEIIYRSQIISLVLKYKMPD